MDDSKEGVNCNSIHSPLHGERGKKIVSDIRKRCLKRSRKYTLKDLNELRHLASCREMPEGIDRGHPTGILSKGLGLRVVSTNSFTTTKEVRFKQIQIAKNLDGYKHYTALIPHKKDRIRNVHPMTPTVSETLTLSKRNFDKKVKMWKKELHRWDAIQSVSDIPHHLLTNRMVNDRKMRCINSKPLHHHSMRTNVAQFTWSPKSPQKSSVSSDGGILQGSEIDETETEPETTACIKKLIFDDDQKDESVYSPSQNKWYKLKNGSNRKVHITRDSAIDCLKLCITNVRMKQSQCDDTTESNCDMLDELIVDEFVQLLQKMFI